MIARLLVIRGRVQGVGYRYAMVEVASAFHVAGWVRNRRDGSVEAFLQGDAAAVEALIAWSRRGPPAAQVQGVAVTAAEITSGIVDFSHRPTA
jgi:acylphosphatase